MKKITGILGVAVIATVMFFNANAISIPTSDTSLVSLIALNKAHADGEGTLESCTKDGTPMVSSTNLLLDNHGTCFDKDGNECGQSNTCSTGNKLPNIPNITSECTPVKCI